MSSTLLHDLGSEDGAEQRVATQAAAGRMLRMRATLGDGNRVERLARLISLVSYPAIFGPIGLVYLGLLLRTAPSDMAKWMGLCVGSFAAPLMLLVARRVRSGQVTDFDVSLRAQRREIYLWGLAFNLLTLALVHTLQGPLFIMAALLSALVAGMLAITANRYLKVSVHSGVSAMIATGVLIVSGPSAWPTLPVVGAIAWSRYRVRRHTPIEIAGGVAVGVVATTLTFKVIGLS